MGNPSSPQEWSAIIERFLQDHLRRSKATGVVVGISGGVDSSVTAAMCVRAFGAERVTAVLLPHDDSNPADLQDGQQLCKHLGLAPKTHNITGIVSEAIKASGDNLSVVANLKARARMLILYAEAQNSRRLVCGTGNKSELLIGYFTKYGDGGVDLEPLGDLYKTQVVELAHHLGLPENLANRVPSAGLMPGQTDEADLGMDYATLDAVLKCIELNTPSEEIPTRAGVTAKRAADVEAMVRSTEHKRHMPLIPKIGARTVGIDWRRSVHWDN